MGDVINFRTKKKDPQLYRFMYKDINNIYIFLENGDIIPLSKKNIKLLYRELLSQGANIYTVDD